MMESAFPAGDGRFDVIPAEREEELICGDIDEAVKCGWDVRLGDLYGVVRRRKRKGGKKLPGRRTVHVPGKCEIPRGYGTVKGVQGAATARPAAGMEGTAAAGAGCATP